LWVQLFLKMPYTLIKFTMQIKSTFILLFLLIIIFMETLLIHCLSSKVSHANKEIHVLRKCNQQLMRLS
jgi:hypothetical protein